MVKQLKRLWRIVKRCFDKTTPLSVRIVDSGDFVINGREVQSSTGLLTWRKAGFDRNVEYLVSHKSFSGAKVLPKRGLGSYYGSDAHHFYFCVTELQRYFGGVPDQIYWREA